MKITLLEMAKKIQNDNPKAFGKMNEKRISMLIKASFEEIKTAIKSDKDDKIQIQGFGRFNIREIESEKEGKKSTKRRVVFHSREKQ